MSIYGLYLLQVFSQAREMCFDNNILFSMFVTLFYCVVLMIIIVILMCAVFLYLIAECCAAGRHLEMLSSSMIGKHVRIPFNKKLFDQESECIICMEKFKKNQNITPLPCDTRHYFHSDCISAWLESSKKCPFCNTEVGLDKY